MLQTSPFGSTNVVYLAKLDESIAQAERGEVVMYTKEHGKIAMNLKSKVGIDVLTKELGALGMALFLRQYDSGYGDYTKERDDLLKDITIDDVEHELGFID